MQCDSATSVHEFLTQVRLPSPTLIGVIGCGCSVATEPVADMVSVYGLPLVSIAKSVDWQYFLTHHNFAEFHIRLLSYASLE